MPYQSIHIFEKMEERIEAIQIVYVYAELLPQVSSPRPQQVLSPIKSPALIKVSSPRKYTIILMPRALHAQVVKVFV